MQPKSAKDQKKNKYTSVEATPPKKKTAGERPVINKAVTPMFLSLFNAIDE